MRPALCPYQFKTLSMSAFPLRYQTVACSDTLPVYILEDSGLIFGVEYHTLNELLACFPNLSKNLWYDYNFGTSAVSRIAYLFSGSDSQHECVDERKIPSREKSLGRPDDYKWLSRLDASKATFGTMDVKSSNFSNKNIE
jgi:hypothetical protein